ncbi:hypothetical protein [Pseudomonas sp. RT6P73]
MKKVACQPEFSLRFPARCKRILKLNNRKQGRIMGSKISRALITGKGPLTALEYEQSPVGSPMCATSGCSARLSFVSRHNRQLASGKTEVLPSYRLRSKETHVDRCKYNLKGQLLIIAKESKSDVFSSVGDDKYEFRLHILLKAFQKLSALEFSEKDRTPREETKNKIYKARGELSGYLRKLKQILELRSLCEDNSDISDKVVISIDGRKVPWSDFYFDHGNLEKLAGIYGLGTSTPPIVIAGKVEAITLPSEKFKYHTVKLNSPYVEPDKDDVVLKPSPQIVLKDSKLADLIDVGLEYVFFGRWKVKESDVGVLKEGGSYWIYHNIEMYIENADHFVEC